MASSLVADYGSSQSEDESESVSSKDSSDSDSEHKDSAEQCEQKRKLPPPLFSDSNAVKNSVFANPYVEAENNKMAVLEKHVKMVPQKTLMSKINGKKVCWMYRKGRCRFGHMCKFAHDSDIINPLGSSSTPDVESVVLCSTDDSTSQDVKTTESADTRPNPQKSERKRKKKPGLSQNLVPGKKVMKLFKSNNPSGLLAP